MRLPLRFRRSTPTTPTAQAPIDVAALLGRKSVNLDTPELQRFVAGKTILVTGAGGSIGSEICRQTMRFCPSRLVLLDRAEPALFEIEQELTHRWVGARIDPIIGDVTDARRIEHVMNDVRPHVIFHAAAHKHVPMMEANPGEAVKNNVFGTQIVADAALACEASAFVMISTDKAVNPTSVMGATKRMAELYVQSLNFRSTARTRFVAVRFGNVLGSSGSVVPIFQKQIAAGGPVTVTHADMKRYFMTIPEASQLVMQAGAIGKGGEIFILDMGDPVKIIDLAREMIRRSGLRENDDIELRVTGIRPGEKLYEELACDDEQTQPTSHKKLRIWQLPPSHPTTVRQMLERLWQTIDGSRDDVVAKLCDCIPEFTPQNRPAARPAPALAIAPASESAAA